MKIYKYILGIGLLTWILSGCSLEEVKPLDVPEEEYALGVDGIPKFLPGTYAKFVSNDWEKMYYQMTEFMGDNVSLSGRTSDPLFFSYTYNLIPNQGNASALWRQGYSIIGTCNIGIDGLEKAIDGGEDSPEVLQALGEFRFLRAYTHFALCGIWGRPYSHGRDNLGVVIKKDLSTESLPRATVGEVYDFVESELLAAADLMTMNQPNYKASKEVAYALLSRLYLYKDQHDDAIEYANLVLNSGRYSLEPTERFKSYFTYNPVENNSETIMCIWHSEETDAGWGGVGSMYSNYNGVGWGEMYASKSYLDLVGENENDARHSFIDPQYQYDDNGNIKKDPDSGEPLYQQRNGYNKFYINKFSLQEGIAQLGSPIIVRLAEMHLNKAEANAKSNEPQLALDEINILRERAGLSGDQLYGLDNMLGKTDALEAVLDERRLELAWEGHRAMDVYRNKLTMDRSYPGTHLPEGSPTQLIPYTDPRIVHFIPQREIDLNPSLIQN